MFRATMLIAMLLAISSCQQNKPHPRDAAETAMFGPAAMRIHPIFTRIQDWTGDGKPDGIEALIEFQDQFYDPTKAMGTAIFELFEYRRGFPDPRGERLLNPWIGSLNTLEEQRQHWNRTSRTYTFQLTWAGIRRDRNYVLGATFELKGGGRFFDRMIIEAQDRPSKSPEPARAPTTSPFISRPATRPVEP
jgi:hypothetical protein